MRMLFENVLHDATRKIDMSRITSPSELNVALGALTVNNPASVTFACPLRVGALEASRLAAEIVCI